MMDPVSAVTGLILAGGAGQRMGLRDKASLRLGGVPMLEHTWHRLKPQTGVVMLAVHEDPV
ncbi:MAG TPA: NTP transferase domain-containing protein, partial [Magnetococcales bacterium]|nr:NTP transferase domain-containing protein [Magnetococcales bacterium]